MLVYRSEYTYLSIWRWCTRLHAPQPFTHLLNTFNFSVALQIKIRKGSDQQDMVVILHTSHRIPMYHLPAKLTRTILYRVVQKSNQGERIYVNTSWHKSSKSWIEEKHRRLLQCWDKRDLTIHRRVPKVGLGLVCITWAFFVGLHILFVSDQYSLRNSQK